MARDERKTGSEKVTEKPEKRLQRVREGHIGTKKKKHTKKKENAKRDRLYMTGDALSS